MKAYCLIIVGIYSELCLTGIEKKRNALSVSAEQVGRMGLDEELFGRTKEKVALSRGQLDKFASELYTRLNVSESYAMPELAFRREAVDTLLSNVAKSTIAKEDFAAANKVTRQLFVL